MKYDNTLISRHFNAEGSAAAYPPHQVFWQLAIRRRQTQLDGQRFERSARCSRCLLFAPRLMLERGLQFTERRRLEPDDA
jgi:hypothetical protein